MHKNYSVSLGTKHHLPLLINTQHYSLFQISICNLWRQATLIKDVFHPPSYTLMTADHSVSGITVDIDCTCKSRNLKIAHMLHNLKIRTQSRDSENAQRNLNIAQIFRLRGTYILLIKEWTCTTIDRLHTIAKGKHSLCKTQICNCKYLGSWCKKQVSNFREFKLYPNATSKM